MLAGANDLLTVGAAGRSTPSVALAGSGLSPAVVLSCPAAMVLR